MNNEKSQACLRIIGRVARPVTLPFSELRAMDNLETEDLPMICGSGEPKGRTGRCRGVLLADVIGRAEVLAPEHNDTKKMFIVAAADDGYKAVFSWQELFNSPNGAAILVVFAKDGLTLSDKEGVELLAACDHLSGPRHIHHLTTIEIAIVA
ncbi:MAG: molybdopterin-dependent oxidoreductase [Desulfobulbaceae bacterium]|jgi:DMSO/TMAO reductase YedYZ molybdopterin-dependent catalytic subunit|nr:molybdopterin-dependent oxidoreductase [Desulfobulbaceae bacterium]